MAAPFSFSSKIAGVTFDNPDGTSRQSLVKTLRIREKLNLTDCSSPEYPEAIGIFNCASEQLGFLPKEDAQYVRLLNKDIKSLTCLVRSVGRTHDYKPYGVQIVVGESYQAASDLLNKLEKPVSYSSYTSTASTTTSYSYSSDNMTNTKDGRSGCALPLIVGIIITVAVMVPIIYVVLKVINFFK